MKSFVSTFALVCLHITSAAQTMIPVDPEGWATESGFVETVRQQFRRHIEGAKNITVPADSEAFAWKINWTKQQAYCKDIADALFKNTQRFSFPEPSFSATRDSSSKLAEVLGSLPPPAGRQWTLSGYSPERSVNEFEKAIAAESKRQGNPTRMYRGVCNSPYWHRNYVGVEGNGVYQYTEMVNPKQAGGLDDAILCRPIEITGSYRQSLDGDWFGSEIFGAFPNDTSPDDRTEKSTVILGAVDGSPVIFEFGTYTFPLVNLGEMGPSKSNFGKPLYGKDGQSYVLVAHPQKNFENAQILGGFAINGPLPEGQGTRGLNGWPDPKFGNDSSRYACFINFDATKRK